MLDGRTHDRTPMNTPSPAPDLQAGRRLHGIDPQTRFAGLDDATLAHLREGGRHLASRRTDEAERSLRAVLAAAPEHPEALRLMATIEHLRGHRAEAVALLRRALARQPDDALALHHLGGWLLQEGAIDKALPLLQRACALAPDLASAWINLGTAHEQEGRFEESLAAFRQAVRCDPRHVAARVACGNGLRAAGRIEEAAAEYRAALAIAPDAVAAWSALADLKTVPFTDAEADALERLAVKPGLEAGDRATLHFALGRVREDRGLYPAAFDAFRIANEGWRARVAWDRDALGELVGRIMDAFSRPLAAAPAPRLGEEVIFVVSLPRSGSTLAEQILSAHSQVEGGGERPELGRVLEEESRRRGQAFPAWVGDATAADWERLGRQYLELTARWRAQAPRSTDKSLTTWLHLGAARAMLPGARFVNARRDAMETAWSIYKHLFATPQPFAYDLADIAACWRDYDRLMHFWHARHPGHIHDLVYEHLQADAEAQVRALLAFCGLPFERACLRFEQSRRSVATASAAQVRQPLRADTARAHFYGDLLAPLRRALEG
jgi:tetratricopeptide (TPR) repeat protein